MTNKLLTDKEIESSKLLADLTKLHAEVNQLRNQEFLVPSGVLVLISTIFSQITYKIYTPLIILLGLMFYWHYTLTIIRTRITQYLILTDLSDWEKRYRDFADIDENRSIGQKITVIAIFQCLAIGIYAWVTLDVIEEIATPNIMNTISQFDELQEVFLFMHEELRKLQFNKTIDCVLTIFRSLISSFFAIIISYCWLYQISFGKGVKINSIPNITKFLFKTNKFYKTILLLITTMVTAILYLYRPIIFVQSLNTISLIWFLVVINNHQDNIKSGLNNIKNKWIMVIDRCTYPINIDVESSSNLFVGTSPFFPKIEVKKYKIEEVIEEMRKEIINNLKSSNDNPKTPQDLLITQFIEVYRPQNETNKRL
jgi:hypothetical protein